MGAQQGQGKVIFAANKYVQNSDNAEVLKIFKNKDDDKWYTKDHLGNITLFPPNNNGKSLLVKGLLTQNATDDAIGTLQQNDVNALTSLTLTRTDIGSYEVDLTMLGYDVDKVNYYICANEVKTYDKLINMKYGTDKVLRVYTSLSDGTLTDSILSRTPFLLEFFN